MSGPASIAVSVFHQIEWWQWLFGAVIVPFAVWVGKQIERAQLRKQQQSSSVHAEIQRLKDDGERLKHDNADLSTQGALQGARIEGYLARIEALSADLAQTEMERDRARAEAADLSRHKAVYQAITLLLRNHVQDLRALLEQKGIAMPPAPILPPEPPS